MSAIQFIPEGESKPIPANLLSENSKYAYVEVLDEKKSHVNRDKHGSKLLILKTQIQ